MPQDKLSDIDLKNLDVSKAYQLGKVARKEGIQLLLGNPFQDRKMFTQAIADSWDQGWMDEQDLLIQALESVNEQKI